MQRAVGVLAPGLDRDLHAGQLGRRLGDQAGPSARSTSVAIADEIERRARIAVDRGVDVGAGIDRSRAASRVDDRGALVETGRSDGRIFTAKVATFGDEGAAVPVVDHAAGRRDRLERPCGSWSRASQAGRRRRSGGRTAERSSPLTAMIAITTKTRKRDRLRTGLGRSSRKAVTSPPGPVRSAGRGSTRRAGR